MKNLTDKKLESTLLMMQEMYDNSQETIEALESMKIDENDFVSKVGALTIKEDSNGHLAINHNKKKVRFFDINQAKKIRSMSIKKDLMKNYNGEKMIAEVVSAEKWIADSIAELKSGQVAFKIALEKHGMI